MSNLGPFAMNIEVIWNGGILWAWNLQMSMQLGMLNFLHGYLPNSLNSSGVFVRGGPVSTGPLDGKLRIWSTSSKRSLISCPPISISPVTSLYLLAISLHVLL